MLTSTGRRVRIAGAVLVIVLLLAGTSWGDDDHFPFGPFRMFSTANEPGGEVNVVVFRGRTVAGRPVEISSSQDMQEAFGLRRAELQARIRVVQRDPSLLGELAGAAGRDGAGSLVELRMYEGTYDLRGGRPVGYVEKELAAWVR